MPAFLCKIFPESLKVFPASNLTNASQQNTVNNITRWANMNRLCNRVEPFAALILCAPLNRPAFRASLHRSTKSMSLYGHIWFNSQGRCAGFLPFPIKYGPIHYAALRSRGIFPRLRLQIFFLALAPGKKNSAPARPLKARLRLQKNNFDTKYLKNLNFNK